MIDLEISAASLVGCVRDNNEDMILVGNRFIRDEQYQTRLSLLPTDRLMLAVADGMGGHNCGEVASSDTLHNLQFFFSDLPSGQSASQFNESIVTWLESINNIIESKGIVDSQYRGMGTTLVALAYYGGDFYSLNCGDSRLYRFREGHLSQLTTDHSLSNKLGMAEHSSIITNCIGGGVKMSYVDMVQITSDVQSGDAYLLCSDGLTDMVSDHRIEQLLADGADARALCDAAVRHGGYDNVSVCLSRIVS